MASKQMKCGKSFLYSEEDSVKANIYSWSLAGANGGYARRATKENGVYRSIYFHVEIMSPPLGYVVDHLDGNKLNNQRTNLRICTETENHQNKRKLTATNSNYKGIYWEKQQNKWRARITVNKQTIHIGFYSNELEAAKAYDRAAKVYFKVAVLNFPEALIIT